VDAAVVHCEPERAGSLPVLAKREALTLGPDVSYGRDVRPLPLAASDVAPRGPPTRRRNRVALFVVLGVLLFTLAVRRRRARAA